jgi:hypothetical protein
MLRVDAGFAGLGRPPLTVWFTFNKKKKKKKKNWLLKKIFVQFPL